MSGRITIDNLSDNLKEMIENSGMTEEQVKELLKNEGNITELQTDSKTIVGAINELFQNANNGKELIADAIGEPLDSSDTFSAMSNDINGLLSTFKTNMMDKGVSVESGDKFKQLIEKIPSIIGKESNESIYSFIHGFDVGELLIERRYFSSDNGFTENEISFNSSSYNGITINVDVSVSATKPGAVCYLITTTEKIDFTSIDSIDFTAKVYVPSSNASISIDCGAFDTEYQVSSYMKPQWLIHTSDQSPKSQVEFTTFTLDTSALTGKHYLGIWFSCSIPTNYSSNGVLFNINMDMIDITFKGENLDSGGNNSGSGGVVGLDIISATSLPATGKENQICVISDNPVNSFLLSSYESDISALDSSTIGIYLNNDATVYDSTKIALSSNNITVNYYINSVSQGDGRLASYIYNNSKWNSLTYKSYPVIENRKLITSYVGNFASDVIIDSEQNGFEISNGSSTSYLYSIISASKKINFDNISKAEFEIRSSRSTTDVDFYIGVTQAEQLNQAYNKGGTLLMCSSYSSINFTHSYFKKYTMDLSNVTGTGYLALVMYCNLQSTTIYIPNLILY